MQLKKRIMIGALIAATGGVAGLANPAEAQLEAPRKVIAVLDGTQNFGNTRRAINYYDVTDVATNGGNLFNQTPLFTVWTGYENTVGANFEDPDTIAVNPANGDTYVLAFDSGPAGVVDGAGDTQGDLDIYKIDYQAVLNDFVANSRPAGTMYAPAVSPDGIANPQHPDHIGSTINLPGISVKIGEVGRTQGGSFFDRDMEYVDPETLVIVDNEQDSSDTTTQDHELRVLSRVSSATGAAVVDASDSDSILGGYNAQTSQSWEANRVGVLNMDFAGGGAIGFSEPEDIALVEKDGIVGVWVAETDSGGDDLSFFELNGTYVGSGVAATPSIIDGLGTSRSLDEDPETDPNTNDGDHDYIKIDAAGNLVIGESGFFDVTPGGELGNSGIQAGEPTVLRLNVDSYGPGTVTTVVGDAWDDLDNGDGLGPVGDPADVGVPVQLEGPLGSLVNTFAGGSGLSLDDDTAVTDGRFATLDIGANLMYIFDIDSGGLPNVVSDVYVIDLNTGEIIYEELNAANHFLVEHGIRHFLRGDINNDGVITADDIDAINDSTSLTALEQEEYDLTSDGIMSGAGTGNADAVELVNEILGTEFGDANLDGKVDGADLSILASNFGASGGWALGNFNGDAAGIDGADLSVLASNFGFAASVSAEASAVPEPASLALLALGGLALIRRR